MSIIISIKPADFEELREDDAAFGIDSPINPPSISTATVIEALETKKVPAPWKN